jgi:nucleoside-diphosphate-sugar epimerase
MIVSITGGRGFIGKHLVDRYIKEGAKVRVLSRYRTLMQKGVESFTGDLSRPGIDFSGFVDGADILFHCAGEINDESLMRQVHEGGTKQLVKYSIGKIGRWVQLSSVGAYKVSLSDVISENSPEIPAGTYEQTKTEADLIVKNSGIPFVILRPSSVFGENMSNQSLFQLVDMVRKGYFFYIGKKDYLVNYVHVGDVIEALVKCGENDKAIGNTYNLSQTTSVENMVNGFLIGLGIERRFICLPKYLIRNLVNVLELLPGFPLTLSRIDALTGSCRYDSSKIYDELGFRFKSLLEKQFRSLVEQRKLFE